MANEIVKTQKRNTSKYEMNLAEFPIAILSKQKPGDVSIIEYSDTITGKGGEVVERVWRVKPSIDNGFGSINVLSTLFELFQIWKEAHFESKIIRFGSPYALLGRTGAPTTGKKAYDRMRQDLSALVEMSFEAKNAFWDSEKQAYVDRTFHLFDYLDIYHRKSNQGKQEMLPFSYIKASDVLWHSIEANSIVTLKNVSRSYFHSLKPTEQRLALYLAKLMHSQTMHRRDVQQIASQMPIVTKQYRSKKMLLKRAADGLMARNYPYFTEYRFEPRVDGKGDNIIFERRGDVATSKQDEDDKVKQGDLIEQIIGYTNDEKSRKFFTKVVNKFPHQAVYTVLSLAKGYTPKNRGAYCTTLFKEYARDHQIDL